MDPLTALSVAASVIQFVQFASSLISSTSEIRNSANGALADNLHLEDVYGKLESFSNTLSAHVGHQIPPGHTRHSGSSNKLTKQKLGEKASPDQVLALVQLSDDCKADCNELLEALEKLKVRNEGSSGKRLWRSVKVSLRTHWDASKIAALEKRLERTQRAVSLHLASFISDQVSGLDFRLAQLRGENARLHIDQSCRLDEISEGIERLSQDLRSLQGRQGSGAAEEGTLGPNQLERIASMLADVISTERGALAEQAVLGSLHFSQRPHRHENIADAHKATFKWVYNSDCPFAQWLVSETGIFWVSGKAGSGKSTLIKFIASNPSTNSLLSEWAPNGLITVAHYFWSAGTEMQKSQKGLLQTLLYDIFQSSPELMAAACPNRLIDGWDFPVRGRNGTEPWSLPELSTALNYIAMADDVPCKFCFFIDGLDEYDGDHLDLCNLMTSLSNSKNIKLCVSSRPWNVFTDTFCDGPKLCMQDLTRGDILAYVNDRLSNHPRWGLLAVGSEVKKQFVQDVADRAEGVFLWAFLVTRSLRSGLTNGDTIQDLRKRLVDLPTDLERLFRHMLDAVDPLYHEKMARMFLIALAATEPLDLRVYANQNEEENDEDYAIRRPAKWMARDELDEIHEQTKRRINAWSSGLLEVHWQYLTVQFLHRSVRDFLHTGEMNNYLAGKLGSKFDAALSISRAFVAITKSPPWEGESRHWRGLDHKLNNAGLAVQFAAQVEPSNRMKILKLMDALEDAMETLSELEGGRFPWEHRKAPRLFVRRLTIHESKLTWYVDIKLKDTTYLGDFREPPINFLLATGIRVNTWRDRSPFEWVGLGTFAEMLDVLLRNGQDPNNTYIEETTCWTEISRLTSAFNFNDAFPDPDFQGAVDNRIASICLAHGADANATEPESGLTAFALYLFACFSGRTRDDRTDNYLRGLGDFLEAGANLDALLNVSGEACQWNLLVRNLFRKEGCVEIGGSPPEFSEGYRKFTEDPLAERPTLCEAHCKLLSNATYLPFAGGWKIIKVDRQRRFAFLSQVTKTLALNADLNAKMAKQLEGAIKHAFPEPVADPLVEILQNRAETNYQKPARARRRKDTQAQLHVPGSKLRCPLCNHSEGEGA